MHKLLRITLLGVFGAAGVGIAIAVATQSKPPAETGQTNRPGFEGIPAASHIANVPLGHTSASPQGESSLAMRLHAPGRNTPQRAGYQDRVAQFPGEAALQQAQQTMQQNRDAMMQNAREFGEMMESQGMEVPEELKQQSSGNSSRRGRASGGTATRGGPAAATQLPETIPTRGNRSAEVTITPGPEVYPGEGDGQLSINVQNSDIRAVLDLLSRQGGLNILAGKSVQGTVSASLSNVDIATALDAILKSTGYVARRDGEFIFVGTPEEFLQMDHSLDRIGTRVYRPNYVTAAELQSLITPMLTPDVGTVSVSTAAEVGIAPDGSSAGGDNFAGAEVLMVRDFEAVLSQVDQVVREVDRRPLQVAIEAMILSVKLDDSNSFGVDFELLRNKNTIRLVSGTPLTDLANLNLTDGGVKVGFLDSSLAIFLDALETVGDVNVIASPRLMCLNKQRAEIHIGREVGYISTTVTENAATQSVEFLEVGTQLRIRPYISADGMIRLEVHPELSTGDVDVRGGFTVPDKDVTQVTTNVMVRNGSTVIIGGLIREDLASTVSQIPLFGSLPLVGTLFRQKKEDIDRNEIMILITPRIVYDEKEACDGERAECEFFQRQAVVADKMTPIGKRYIGRRYLRLARNAWGNGEQQKALRYINLAVHYDPLNREAVSFRGEIVSSTPLGDRTVHMHLKEGLAPWGHPVSPGPMPNWVMNQVIAPPPPANPPPGEPTPGPPTPMQPIR